MEISMVAGGRVLAQTRPLEANSIPQTAAEARMVQIGCETCESQYGVWPQRGCSIQCTLEEGGKACGGWLPPQERYAGNTHNNFVALEFQSSAITMESGDDCLPLLLLQQQQRDQGKAGFCSSSSLSDTAASSRSGTRGAAQTIAASHQQSLHPTQNSAANNGGGKKHSGGKHAGQAAAAGCKVGPCAASIRCCDPNALLHQQEGVGSGKGGIQQMGSGSSGILTCSNSKVENKKKAWGGARRDFGHRQGGARLDPEVRHLERGSCRGSRPT